MNTIHAPSLFLSVQFPFADVRPFVQRPTGRLPVPSFPLAQAANKEFVHRTGAVQDRRNTQVSDWKGEEVFSGAPRALRFENRLGGLRLGQPSTSLMPVCTFRRLFSDGVMSRLEVGLRLSAPPDRLSLDPEQVRAVLDTCSNLPVWVRGADGHPREHKLLDAGPALARHLLRSTTRVPKDGDPSLEPWWITAGRPLVLLEHRPMNVLALPPGSEVLEPVSHQDFRLAYLAFPRGRAFIGTWILGSSPPTDVDLLRRLRIHLFRLHSEREALRLVLQQYETLGFEPAEDASRKLRRYLEKVDGLFKRGRRYGFQKEVLLDLAKWGTDRVRPGDMTTVLARLEEVRGEIYERVRIDNEERRRAENINIAGNSGPVIFVGGNVTGTTVSQRIREEQP